MHTVKMTAEGAKSKTELKLEKAEIVMKLAAMKNAFFSAGIEGSMKDRTALELRVAEIELELLRNDRVEFGMRTNMKARQYELLRERLIDNGLPNLWSECEADAKREFFPSTGGVQL